VEESPLERLLGAIDRLDLDGVVALMAPRCSLLAVDGRHAEGPEAVRAALSDFLGTLRSTAHRITAQWHQEDVWIAEVEADYVLEDWLQINRLMRAFVVRDGADGITSVHVYGAHERSFADHDAGDRGLHLGGHWVPPL